MEEGWRGGKPPRSLHQGSNAGPRYHKSRKVTCKLLTNRTCPGETENVTLHQEAGCWEAVKEPASVQTADPKNRHVLRRDWDHPPAEREVTLPSALVEVRPREGARGRQGPFILPEFRAFGASRSRRAFAHDAAQLRARRHGFPDSLEVQLVKTISEGPHLGYRGPPRQCSDLLSLALVEPERRLPREVRPLSRQQMARDS